MVARHFLCCLPLRLGALLISASQLVVVGLLAAGSWYALNSMRTFKRAPTFPFPEADHTDGGGAIFFALDRRSSPKQSERYCCLQCTILHLSLSHCHHWVSALP
jgi:hypothetical protein